MPKNAKSGWLWSGDGGGDIHVIGELAQLVAIVPEQNTTLRASFVQPELLNFSFVRDSAHAYLCLYLPLVKKSSEDVVFLPKRP